MSLEDNNFPEIIIGSGDAKLFWRALGKSALYGLAHKGISAGNDSFIARISMRIDIYNDIYVLELNPFITRTISPSLSTAFANSDLDIVKEAANSVWNSFLNQLNLEPKKAT